METSTDNNHSTPTFFLSLFSAGSSSSLFIFLRALLVFAPNVTLLSPVERGRKREMPTTMTSVLAGRSLQQRRGIPWRHERYISVIANGRLISRMSKLPPLLTAFDGSIVSPLLLGPLAVPLRLVEISRNDIPPSRTRRTTRATLLPSRGASTTSWSVHHALPPAPRSIVVRDLGDTKRPRAGR